MPGYADLDAVRTILQLEEAFQPEASDADSRLAALNESLSIAFDTKVGRTWAGTGAATTREVWPANRPGPVLALPGPGITSLAWVKVDPDWTGSAWTGGTLIAADEVVPVNKTIDGRYLGLRRAYGWRWTGVALVNGVWADSAGATPPADVVEALTFIVAEEYKAERASPEAMIGPDGLQVSTRNPWRFERVQAAIERYRVTVL